MKETDLTGIVAEHIDAINDGGFGVAHFYRQGLFGVAHLYQQFLEDLREGRHSVPDFSDAVVRHRSIHNASSMP